MKKIAPKAAPKASQSREMSSDSARMMMAASPGPNRRERRRVAADGRVQPRARRARGRGMSATKEEHETLDDAETGGLGPLELIHLPGSWELSPASRTAIRTIGEHAHLLRGTGIDWGCGGGAIAINAARVPAVSCIFALDIEPASVASTLRSRDANGEVASKKVLAYEADSYSLRGDPEPIYQAALQSGIDFIVSNPPSSEGDDGFGFRRQVLREGSAILKPGGPVFLSISYQYGEHRIRQLCEDAPGYSYDGVLSTTDWVPFLMPNRPDLDECLQLYAAAEEAGEPVRTYTDCRRG